MAYTKTNWASGDKVTAEKLNNIESGIENTDKKVELLNKDIENAKKSIQNIYNVLPNEVSDSFEYIETEVENNNVTLYLSEPVEVLKPIFINIYDDRDIDIMISIYDIFNKPDDWMVECNGRSEKMSLLNTASLGGNGDEENYIVFDLVTLMNKLKFQWPLQFINATVEYTVSKSRIQYDY